MNKAFYLQTSETARTRTPIEMLRRHAFYASIPEDDLQILLEAGRVRSFHRGEILHSPYDICREFTLVVTGSVQVVRYVPGERELIMRHVNAGETYGEIMALARFHYPGWLRAADAGHVMELPIDRIIGWCRNEQFLRSLLKEIAVKTACLSEKVDLLAAGSLEDRLMLYLSKELDRQHQTQHQASNGSDDSMNRKKREEKQPYGDWIKLPMTKTDMAKQFGCSREALSRTFHTLTAKGVIEMNGRDIKFVS